MTEGFKIIGIDIKTTNQNGQAQTDLGNLWGRFFAEAIIDKIPNKISNQILAIYTDYKSNYTEEYTTIIGMQVSTLEEVPAGMVGREFPAEKWQVFTAIGEMPQAIANTWGQIWSSDQTLNRKYSYDFELYGEKSQNGEHSEVDIYISLKN